jgi:hypothetical protein
MELFERFKDLILTPATLAVVSLGFLYFMWGLYSFMRAAQSGGNVNDGKNHMLYGIIGMFIMISVYSIIAIIANTIGVDPQNPADTSRLNAINPGNPAFNPFRLQ